MELTLECDLRLCDDRAVQEQPQDHLDQEGGQGGQRGGSGNTHHGGAPGGGEGPVVGRAHGCRWGRVRDRAFPGKTSWCRGGL